ncbi:MAG: flagellar basal body protein, partial [Oscillospiraceae bacterium]|nr:flagellar basal body protein [Oscillospiraceae bacterium]
MASSFMGLFVQRDGLNLAQKALDITGSNITNVQTEGYTRQRLDVVTVKQSSKSLGYTNQIHLAGAGNEGEGVTQTRDDILDAKFRKYTSVHADLETKSNVLSDIEDAIDDIENDSTGFAAIFGKFKDSLQSISSAGTDQTDLANVAKNAAQNVVNVLKNFDSRIDSIAQDTLNDFNATIKRTNDILRQCAKNNEYIKSGYVQNNNVYDNGYGFQADVNYGPLEMKDEMNSLIDELSGYFDVSSQVEPDGTFTISISGQQVVYNNTYAKLTADENKTFTNLSVSVTTLKLDAKWKNMRCRYEDGNVDLANGMKDALAAVSEDNTTENMNNMKALTQKLRDGGETALADAIDADLNSGDFEAAGEKIDSYMEDNGYDLVNKINDLLIKGDFESAKNTEDDLMAKL